MKQSKKQKRLQRRKMKRRYLKWLIQNRKFWSWVQVRKLKEKPNKQIYWRFFLNCFFLEGILCSINKEGNGYCHCPCKLYTPKQR